MEQLPEPASTPAAARAAQAIEDVMPERAVVLGERGGPLAWIEYLAMRAAIGSLARLPYRLRAWIVAVLARLAASLMRRRVGFAREYLRQALGPELEPRRRDRLVRLAFAHLCHVVIDDVARQQRIAPEHWLEHVRFEGEPELLAEFRRGGPAVLLNLHLGDWEMLAQTLAVWGYGPLYVVGKPTRNRPISAWIQRQREKGGVFMIPRYGAIESAQKAVQAGGSLGLMLDHRATSRPVVAPFFGRLALSERSAGILVRRLGLPTFVVVCHRTERPYHYRVRVERLFPVEETRRMSPEEFTRQLNECFERLILEHPEQYFWLHDRYRGVEKTLRREAKGKVRRVKVQKPEQASPRE